MRAFNCRSEELSVHDGCVLWGSRVIIPKNGHHGVLELLYDGHPGISHMKEIARSIVWWPRLTNKVEEMVRNCSQCQQHQKASPQSPLYLGNGHTCLIVVDACSKWMEVEVEPSTAASYTS